ncbi:MAG: ABC transporter ATP-binding protein [Lentisphaerae bacterium]|nr:ABC transporter ATP-binding protein [Lentisphaerota bacterium]
MILKADNVHKTYTMARKGLHILRGASLSVGDQESLAVIGVSGAGKSTLLHILGGLDRPESGQVWLGDDPLYGISSRKRTRLRATQIGFVFQSYHLLPEMDVLENVILPAMALAGGLSEAQRRKRGMELLESVGLADRCEHRPMELSGGEQQRVALARALMNQPRLVLADEPTGNLDDGTGRQILDLLFTLTRRDGHALVLVTHHRETALRCDRVLRLEQGVLVPADGGGGTDIPRDVRR